MSLPSMDRGQLRSSTTLSPTKSSVQAAYLSTARYLIMLSQPRPAADMPRRRTETWKHRTTAGRASQRSAPPARRVRLRTRSKTRSTSSASTSVCALPNTVIQKDSFSRDHTVAVLPRRTQLDGMSP